MSTEKEDDLIRIPVIRHEQEIEKRFEKMKKSNRRWKVGLTILILFGFLFGWLFGSISPIPYFHSLRDGIHYVTPMDSSQKIEQVLEIMSQDWFFANQIDDIETQLTDQALYGMTNNVEIDKHTSYMSSEEIASFTQSINRNFVGIGVEYITASDGVFYISRVFKNSPAEKAGVLPGDRIRNVDGTSVEGLTSDDVVDMVRGEEGTKVNITFERAGEAKNFTITRAPINTTVYGRVLEGNIGLLEIMQFGDTTAEEAKGYLNEFQERGVQKLIIDLRGDGGGYLESLRAVASLFIPGNVIVMQEVYADGEVEYIRTSSGQNYDFGPIVLLIDEDTASASEVFVLAMQENRDDITTVGKTTYGKGTVQVTRYFDDGSAVKYTSAKWISSQGIWVNEVGITPDYEEDYPFAVTLSYGDMQEEEEYHEDEVSDFVYKMQVGLDFLGYPIDRKDGYFSKETKEVILQFQKDEGIPETGVLDRKTYMTLFSKMMVAWKTTDDHDNQLHKALELLNG